MKTRENLYGKFPLPVHPRITFATPRLHGAFISLAALATLATLAFLVSLVHP